MEKGRISFDKIRNAPDLSADWKAPPTNELQMPKAGSLSSDEYWEAVGSDGVKLKSKPTPPTGWIWQLDEMVEVEVYDAHRRVMYRNKKGEKRYYWESYTTHRIPPNARRWDKDGNLIEATDDRGADHYVADILNPIVEEKTDVQQPVQLSLFR